ncbi:Cellulose-binding domain, fungal [Phytophthora cactorum]|nr:Cellulose-binding domain, fungal [Phytophthora cactorum]
MVKISLVLVVAACAIMGNSALTEAVDVGSASNDTSASIDVVVGDESGSNDANGSVASPLSPVYDNSASVDADTSTTSPTATTATPAVDDGSAHSDSSTIPWVDDTSTSIAASPTATTATPAVVDDGSVLTDSGDDSTLDDTSVATDAPTSMPTVASPDTPAPTAKAGPIPISGQAKLVPGYEDCGGFGFDYKAYMPKDVDTSMYKMLTCEKGYRCQEVQGSSTYRCNEWPSGDPVPFYGQCGGGNYDGQTFCAPGAVCKYISVSFSQCLPTY